MKEGILSPTEIAMKLNESSALNLKTKTSVFNSETTPEFKKKNFFKSSKSVKIRTFKNDKVSYFKYNGAICIMDTKEVLAPSERKFKEAKGLVTAAYQNELQAKWLSELRAKSKVEIVEAILYSAKKFK
jgi:peptidyl-prolyl cis-trans isomerase SurA